MDIIINALYTHKEVFLRELISNASDALDKIRYLAVKDPDLLKEFKDMKIMIEYNKQDKTVSVIDTGIGMTKEHLIKYLGTVARSGTAKFVEALSKGETTNFIGQFGVGFYSNFLVAKKVVVTSKHNDDDQHIWISQAGGSFTVIKDPKGNTLKRGTRVTVYLREDAEEFLEQEAIKKLAKKYSEFINYPIYINMQRQITKEVEEMETKEEEELKPEEVEVKEDNKEEKKKKNITETVWQWELINEQKALWLRDKDDITEEEYYSFYKSITKHTDIPITYSHVKAEGDIEFKSILYIPSEIPNDILENYYGKSKAIKLYVRRVLITEEFEDLMPRYLNFIKGILDSDDLPLNVNREQLQQQKVMKVITKKLIRNALKMIEELANAEKEYEMEDEAEKDENKTAEANKTEETKLDETEDKNATDNETLKYEKFYKNFGKNIKLGVIEDAYNRHILAKLLRFYSTKSLDKLTSLKDYVKRKKKKQDILYYLAGDSKDILYKSPLLQKLKSHDIEVLLLEDPIDEYCMNSLSEYKKLKVQNAAKGDIKFFEDEEDEKMRMKMLEELYKPLTDWWKKHLGKKIEKMEISTRLTDSPCAISTSEYGYSANMERISKAQAFSTQEKMGA